MSETSTAAHVVIIAHRSPKAQRAADDLLKECPQVEERIAAWRASDGAFFLFIMEQGSGRIGSVVAGDGDDLLVWDAADTLNGGSGRDTLLFGTNGTLQFDGSKIINLEVFDLGRNDDNNNAVSEPGRCAESGVIQRRKRDLCQWRRRRSVHSRGRSG